MSNHQNEPKGFNDSKNKAKDLLNDQGALKNLLDKALKILSKSPGNLQGYIQEIAALVRMVQNSINGKYNQVSSTSMLLIIAGLVYLVNPFDLVPDFLLGIGFLDDATVIGYVLFKTREEIIKYLNWEKQNTQI